MILPTARQITAVPVGLLISLAAALPIGAKEHRQPSNASRSPNGIIEQMVKAVGGRARYHNLKTIEYTYTYRLPNGKEDVSLERYMIRGEKSWARYSKRQARALPQLKGLIVQAFNGKATWMTQDGTLIDNDKQLRMADFARKTNYYWFAMMFKLLDSGLTYRYEGRKTLASASYDLVRVGFKPGIGDVQDTYLLFVNTRTHLVDQFLFTVMDFNRKEPFLMRVAYQTVSGLKLPAKRRYAPSNWSGDVAKDAQWTLEIMSKVRVNRPFGDKLFERPKTPWLSTSVSPNGTENGLSALLLAKHPRAR